MKFKIILLSVFLSSLTLASYSQTSDEEADAIINLLGIKKKEAITKMVPVTGKDSATFWKLYSEYQAENKKTAKSRMKLYERTAQAYSDMNATIADSLIQSYMVNRSEQEKSLEKYYNKIKTAVNPVVGFEFYQAETYLLTLIRASIMEQIPTYGEVRNAMKK